MLELAVGFSCHGLIRLSDLSYQIYFLGPIPKSYKIAVDFMVLTKATRGS